MKNRFFTHNEVQGYTIRFSDIYLNRSIYKKTSKFDLGQTSTKLALKKEIHIENGDGQLETITVPNGMHQMMIQGANGEHQVLQVLSLKDATSLTKAMAAMSEVKSDDHTIKGLLFLINRFLFIKYCHV
uniref:CSON015445 protein n=1 Tax=Culicoides sonorensis TaxID=179676 RepID=A0A336MD93_CULSO